jgi:hypothetical protein
LQLGFDTNSGQITATAGNPYLKPAITSTAWVMPLLVMLRVVTDW